MSLLPNLLTMLGVIGGVDRIINANNHDQRPCEGHKDPIESQCMSVMSLTPSKRIVPRHSCWEAMKERGRLDTAI